MLSYRILERPAQNYVRRRTRHGAAEIRAKHAAAPAVPPAAPLPEDAPPENAPPEDALPDGTLADGTRVEAERPALVSTPEPVVPWEYDQPVQLGPWVPQQTPSTDTASDPISERPTEPIPRLPPPATLPPPPAAWPPAPRRPVD